MTPKSNDFAVMSGIFFFFFFFFVKSQFFRSAGNVIQQIKKSRLMVLLIPKHSSVCSMFVHSGLLPATYSEYYGKVTIAVYLPPGRLIQAAPIPAILQLFMLSVCMTARTV